MIHLSKIDSYISIKLKFSMSNILFAFICFLNSRKDNFFKSTFICSCKGITYSFLILFSQYIGLYKHELKLLKIDVILYHFLLIVLKELGKSK